MVFEKMKGGITLIHKSMGKGIWSTHRKPKDGKSELVAEGVSKAGSQFVPPADWPVPKYAKPRRPQAGGQRRRQFTNGNNRHSRHPPPVRAAWAGDRGGTAAVSKKASSPAKTPQEKRTRKKEKTRGEARRVGTASELDPRRRSTPKTAPGDKAKRPTGRTASELDPRNRTTQDRPPSSDKKKRRKRRSK